MSQERFKIGSFVSLILKKESKVLLIRRFNTGCEDGMYGCAGGGVDGNEPITQAIIREASEELGIRLKKDDIKMLHIVHKKNGAGQEMIGFFLEASEWEGEPKNMEPHKCDDIGWFDLQNLPTNCQPTFKHVINMLEKNIFYSELGWE